ncbi:MULTISPECIES: recombinase family protein [Vibrio harveyi group]|uniref:recombinase family protein n=1 Tax=Vibrio harveyi group TaxID=717610 RepID=UPI001123422C|nr:MULTISPECIES: recombinase family protein [Vibrio harveyi group]ELA8362077.1 recombinase family protein [Vibrio alginolyticus]ELA8364564.1 recombinase family protein [Vibrio alginolyticus]KAB5598648.1 helix-turn-helix domain-containing protein [Vibrio parahaemolyticus]MCR9515646.1 recombinase family protein [Vibrio alginolyticus]MCR9728607.1 recombinase family protein [Vibrio parahaemolyticus]
MALIGYARVSTADQDLSAQLEALTAAGCQKIFYGKQSGKSDDNKKKLAELLNYVREGDTVVLTKLDRMGRSLNMILATIQQLQEQGVQVKTLDWQVDTTSNNAMQRAMTQLLGVFAELEHSIIVDRLQSGRERTGNKGGRKSAINEAQRKEIKQKLSDGASISALAREYGTSRATIHRIID